MLDTAANVPILFRREQEHEAVTDPIEPTDAEVDAVIDEFGGDLREAVRALLRDIAILAGDFAATVSRGYVRGRHSTVGARRTGGEREGPR